MKKILLLSLSVFFVNAVVAQIYTPGGVNNSIFGSNVLMDGSSTYSTEAGAPPYVGKGIIVPSVDLVNFEFDLTLADGFTFPTYFDGMIVYNNATGTTLTTGNRSSTATPVTPGFYYFSNPNGYNNGNVTGGVWKSVGGASTPSGRVVTGNTTLTTGDDNVILNSTSSATFTLPAASAASGKVFRITNYAYSSGGDITFSTGIKYNTSTSTSLNEMFSNSLYVTNTTAAITIQSDGTDWWFVAR